MYELIVGLSGLSACGKTTACRALQKEFDCDYFHFVDVLKDLCKHLFGLTEEQVRGGLKDTVDEHLGVTPREILVGFGMKAREYRPNVWVIACLNIVVQKDPKAKVAILDATRFPNEIKAIHDLGGKVIRIEKKGQAPRSNCATEGAQLEIKKDCFDAIIEAEHGDIAGLSEQVVHQVKQWLKN